MKKCKEGHYYCYQDSKCKPIPKGFRRGVGGYLRREREDEKEDSKKNGNGNGKSNGSSNGNGNGGNGSGNGNGSSGGNGGGNGSGGVGESFETIQNSDGDTTAVVVDIIGPAHMRPRLNGQGVWKGTHITEAGKIAFGGYKDGIIINPSGSRNKYGLPDNMKPEEKTKEVPLTPSQNRLLVKNTKMESVAAIPQAANIAAKAAPYVMTGIGALGTMMQIKKKGKRKLSAAEKKLFDKSQTDTDQKDDMIRSNPKEIDKQNKLVDRYSKRHKTPKQKTDTQKFLKGLARGEIIQDEFSAPTNNVGGGQIAGTVEAGDNPPVKKKKKTYAYGGRGSRKMWMNNK